MNVNDEITNKATKPASFNDESFSAPFDASSDIFDVVGLLVGPCEGL